MRKQFKLNYLFYSYHHSRNTLVNPDQVPPAICPASPATGTPSLRPEQCDTINRSGTYLSVFHIRHAETMKDLL